MRLVVVLVGLSGQPAIRSGVEALRLGGELGGSRPDVLEVELGARLENVRRLATCSFAVP